MKTETSSTINSTNRLPRYCRTVAFLALSWFALVPQARAVCQEGCDLSNGNTFLGDDALTLDTTGLDNTAIGFNALLSNSTGSYNTATGFQTLLNNTIGTFNTATGRDALNGNTTGGSNTAVGVEALISNTTGSSNTAIGVVALLNNNGDNNIAVGANAGINLTTGSNNIHIGNAGATAESRTIRIGTRGTQRNTFVAGISGVTVANGVGVIIDTNGHLGTMVSSARFKDDIKPMDKASEAILALKPVTFRYKQELDPDGIPQFGLVAEQVEKVNSDLVARDDQGKPYTVRYEAVNAMLLNEFLKEHRKVEEHQRKIESLEKAVAQQQRDNETMRVLLEEQTAEVAKVSAKLTAMQARPGLVARK
jgi:hypothetical protein